jgi:hypothetical protein
VVEKPIRQVARVAEESRAAETTTRKRFDEKLGKGVLPVKIHPFSDGDSYSTFRNCREKVCQEIRSLDNDYVLKASPTELEEYYLDQGRVEPLILHSDQHYIERQEPTKIDVTHDFRRGVFPGNGLLYRARGSTLPFHSKAIRYYGKCELRLSA